MSSTTPTSRATAWPTLALTLAMYALLLGNFALYWTAPLPLVVHVAISAVATQGSLPRPHLIRGAAPKPVRVDVKPSTFRVVRDALREAVVNGTGTRGGLEAIAVAGKTGTAQVYGHSAGVDSDTLPKHERDHAWFVGYAPADRPRIAFAVVVEHGGHGGESAAPVARRVLEVFFAPDSEGDPQHRAGRGNHDV